jgi:hypothetical protein
MHFFFTPLHIETAHHDNRCFWLDVCELLDKLKSGGAGHDKVHDQGVVVSGMSQYHSCGRRLGHVHLHTLISQSKPQAIGECR